MIVSEYNYTYHNKIEMKPADVISSTYIDFAVINNDKEPKFEIDNHVRTSRSKNIFAKGYTPNQSENVFVIK